MIIKPSIKIIATILAKNEEDIIGETIEHHIRQGVKQFIVTDNASTDRTREIVSKCPEVVEIIDEPENTHHQSAWVSRMARLACKFNPDWIVHLDADEMWVGLQNLRSVRAPVAACEGMYLHPPTEDCFSIKNQKWYVDVDKLVLSQETKIAHRPDPDIRITHGNHGVENPKSTEVVRSIHRHHYPIRSYPQWRDKAKKHLCLKNRNSICKRWENWYDMLQADQLEVEFHNIVNCWKQLVQGGNEHSDFMKILSFWCTPEVLKYFKDNEIMPRIGEWP